MQKLRALGRFEYANRQMKADDRFEASDEDAVPLVLLGRAQRLPKERDDEPNEPNEPAEPSEPNAPISDTPPPIIESPNESSNEPSDELSDPVEPPPKKRKTTKYKRRDLRAEE